MTQDSTITNELLGELTSAMNRFKHSDFKLKPIGDLRSHDVQMLLITAHHSSICEDGLTISAISEMVGVTSSSITQQVARLVSLGYLKKTVSQSDRRSVFVSMTPKAFRLMLEFKKGREIYLSNLISYLGKQDCEEYIRLVHKISDYNEEIKLLGGTQ